VRAPGHLLSIKRLCVGGGGETRPIHYFLAQSRGICICCVAESAGSLYGFLRGFDAVLTRSAGNFALRESEHARFTKHSP
jgi:hypothetical protein